jgi:hypothetical protein
MPKVFANRGIELAGCYSERETDHVLRNFADSSLPGCEFADWFLIGKDSFEKVDCLAICTDRNSIEELFE